MRSRSLERERDRIARDDSKCDSYRKRRSRSPPDERSDARRRDSADDLRSEPRHRSYRGDRDYSRRHRDSPSPKAKRTVDDYARRHSSHHHNQRNGASRLPRSRSPPSKRSDVPLPSQQAAYSADPTSSLTKQKPEDTEKQKPNYAPTGALAAETNTVANTSIVLKYNEPPESRLPPSSSPYRLYVFKGSETLETLPLHERTCWLFGRERAVVDHATEHPSCSKQHAVLQFRYTEKRDEWGERKGGVKLYVIDLESANGTRVNGDRVPERRFVEVKSGDVITFGESTREYVVLLPPKEEKKKS